MRCRTVNIRHHTMHCADPGSSPDYRPRCTVCKRALLCEHGCHMLQIPLGWLTCNCRVTHNQAPSQHNNDAQLPNNL